ncbi:serine/threonine-protein kinase STY8 [Prunus yedoensis var. nudiflora]|uniref:Serine/threonine-protein kinase STY8 n=1 Tax=Prunus yedoensis var. nudiflora TaxID=2094558 RepID=A0A314XIN5_PRUYE|nr:serine/threonine-protein kinase STY8 [Prunus yedoensis var. nudiflora]
MEDCRPLSSSQLSSKVINSHLVKPSADVNSTDRWGRTPLSEARSFSQEAVCKILEARGGIDPGLTPNFRAMKLNTLGEHGVSDAYWRGRFCYFNFFWNIIATKAPQRTSYTQSLVILPLWSSIAPLY